MKPFTDPAVRALATRGVPGDYVDAGLPGLFLRVGRKSASWSVSFKVAGEGGQSASGHRLKGKAKRLHIGDFPAIGLAEARRRASDAIARAIGGEDPKIAKAQEATVGKETLDGLIDRYLDEYVRPGLRSASNAGYEFDCHWRPKFGKRPYRVLTRRELNDHILSIARNKDHGPGAALEAKRWIVAVFGWATRRDFIGQNPASGLVGRNDLRQRPTDLRPRERVLSMEEARAAFTAAGQMSEPWGPLAQVLLLTLARLGEFKKSQWKWFDPVTENLEVPGVEYKNGDPKTIPLPKNVVKILSSRTPGDEGPYMFSTTGGKKHVFSYADAYADELRARTAKELSRVKGKEVAIDHFTLHDFRRTGATHLTAAGVAPEVVELLLGHRIGGIRGVYMKHKYLEERRRALELWCSLLGVSSSGLEPDYRAYADFQRHDASSAPGWAANQNEKQLRI